MHVSSETVPEGGDGVLERSVDEFRFEMTGCLQSVRYVADLVLTVDAVSRRSNKYQRPLLWRRLWVRVMPLKVMRCLTDSQWRDFRTGDMCFLRGVFVMTLAIAF